MIICFLKIEKNKTRKSYDYFKENAHLQLIN